MDYALIISTLHSRHKVLTYCHIVYSSVVACFQSAMTISNLKLNRNLGAVALIAFYPFFCFLYSRGDIPITL